MSKKKHHLPAEEVEALSFSDGVLFHDIYGAPYDAPQILAPVADTHGHLGSLHEHKPAKALARAAAAGVRLLVVPIDMAREFPIKWQDPEELEEWFEKTIAQARMEYNRLRDANLVVPCPLSVSHLFENVFFMAGAHPYSAPQYTEEAEQRLFRLFENPRCVGIGEIGLDFGPYCEVSEELQLSVFERQLNIALEHNYRVELHLRDGAHDTRAHNLAYSVLKQLGVPDAGCDLHCYTDGPEVMQPFVELGCYIAFGGALTFKRSDDIRSAMLSCPDEQLLSETDFPYMAPEPLRGGECTPDMVVHTVERLAELRWQEQGIPKQKTYAILWKNTQRFLGRTDVCGAYRDLS